jgi:flagellin
MQDAMSIDIPAGLTIDEARFYLQDLCYYYGMDYYVEGNYAALVTKNAGSNQSISVSGDAELLAFFGLYDGIANGTDARVDVDYGYTTEPPMPQGLSAKANGNQVTIFGTRGEEIRFNIDLIYNSLDPANGDVLFTHGDRTAPPSVTVAHAQGTANTVTHDDIDMVFDIKDYGPIMLQIGANYNNAMSVQIPKLNSETLGLVEYKGGIMNTLVNYKSFVTATFALSVVDNAISIVSTARSRLGAFQNRLEATVRSLDTAAENTDNSRSIVRDTDVARETTLYAQRNMMYQTGLAMLAQANMRPQQILSLLQ